MTFFLLWKIETTHKDRCTQYGVTSTNVKLSSSKSDRTSMTLLPTQQKKKNWNRPNESATRWRVLKLFDQGGIFIFFKELTFVAFLLWQCNEHIYISFVTLPIVFNPRSARRQHFTHNSLFLHWMQLLICFRSPELISLWRYLIDLEERLLVFRQYATRVIFTRSITTPLCHAFIFYRHISGHLALWNRNQQTFLRKSYDFRGSWKPAYVINLRIYSTIPGSSI